MYYRFEIWLEGEPAGVGFLQGLDDIGIGEEEAERLIKPFDQDLPYPPDEILANRWTKSWFTEEGYTYFRSAIDDICATYWATDMWEAVLLTQDQLDNIIYEDEFQVIEGYYD